MIPTVIIAQIITDPAPLTSGLGDSFALPALRSIHFTLSCIFLFALLGKPLIDNHSLFQLFFEVILQLWEKIEACERFNAVNGYYIIVQGIIRSFILH